MFRLRFARIRLLDPGLGAERVKAVWPRADGCPSFEVRLSLGQGEVVDGAKAPALVVLGGPGLVASEELKWLLVLVKHALSSSWAAWIAARARG